jgi:hypothetical protein
VLTKTPPRTCRARLTLAVANDVEILATARAGLAATAAALFGIFSVSPLLPWANWFSTATCTACRLHIKTWNERGYQHCTRPCTFSRNCRFRSCEGCAATNADLVTVRTSRAAASMERKSCLFCKSAKLSSIHAALAVFTGFCYQRCVC